MRVFPIQLPELGRAPLLTFLERRMEFFDAFKQRCIFIDSTAFLELVCHLLDRRKEALDIHHTGHRDHPLLRDKDIGCRPAVLMSSEAHLWQPGIGLHEIGKRQYAGKRVEVTLL